MYLTSDLGCLMASLAETDRGDGIDSSQRNRKEVEGTGASPDILLRRRCCPSRLVCCCERRTVGASRLQIHLVSKNNNGHPDTAASEQTTVFLPPARIERAVIQIMASLLTVSARLVVRHPLLFQPATRPAICVPLIPSSGDDGIAISSDRFSSSSLSSSGQERLAWLQDARRSSSSTPMLGFCQPI